MTSSNDTTLSPDEIEYLMAPLEYPRGSQKALDRERDMAALAAVTRPDKYDFDRACGTRVKLDPDDVYNLNIGYSSR